MLRFIFAFIFFAFLFYAIWFFFPEAFQVLVSWVAKIFDMMKGLIEQLSGKKVTPPPPETPKALFTETLRSSLGKF